MRQVRQDFRARLESEQAPQAGARGESRRAEVKLHPKMKKSIEKNSSQVRELRRMREGGPVEQSQEAHEGKSPILFNK